MSFGNAIGHSLNFDSEFVKIERKSRNGHGKNTDARVNCLSFAHLHGRSIGHCFTRGRVVEEETVGFSGDRVLCFFSLYGYKVERISCIDMFPSTVHVETVVLLSKKA